MRRSLLGITHTKHIKFKIKQSILLAILTFIFVALGGGTVSALDLSQESIEVTGQSPTTRVIREGYGNLSITPELEFTRLDDFITYRLVIKNNDGKRYKILSITDDNSNDAISLSYTYPTDMDTNNKAISFTVRYVKIATAPLKPIHADIKIVDEDDASQNIPIVIPNTGASTSFDAASAVTVQSIIIYIVFAGICFAIYIIVKRRKTKEDEKAKLGVPKTMLVLALLLGIVPVAVIAASFETIYFTVNLTKVVLDGPFEVTFDTDEGGTPIPPQIVNKGDTITPPATQPERRGYDFAGWVDKNGDPFVFTDPVTGPVTVKAKWNLKTYDITYDLADDSTDPATVSGNPATYTVETANITLNNPTREHYDFTGWTGTDLAGPTMTVTISKGSINDRSYTATWKKKEYKATFDTNGGTPAVDSQTRKYGETFTEPSLTATIKKGYNLDGWLLNGAPYNFATPASADIDLKAKWSIINYDITYDWDGGTPGTPANPDTYTVEDTFTLTNPTKYAYDFLGWVGSNNDQPETTVTVAKGTTGDLYFDAIWEATEYTITYKGGGTADPANPTTYNIETTTFELTNPTKDNAVFIGWTWPGMTTPQMKVEITQGTSGDLTYTANWHEILTVTYDVNGGSAVSPVSFEVESGNEIGTLASTDKDHYDFLGWYLGDEKIESTYIVRDNITIKAKWKPTEYPINYVLGPNATVDPANPTTYNIETTTFELTNPKRAGYRFLGWTRGAGGTPEMTVTVTQGTTGELHFNAHWLDLVVVEFDPDGGTYPDPDALELDPGSVITSLPETTRKGYNFKGWYLNDQKIETPYKVSDDGGDDITLVAKWELITYDITYDLADDATDPATVSGNPATYTVETANIRLNNPTREHYDFVGWSGTDITDTSDDVTISKGSIGDRSYTANWKKKEYTATFDTDGGTPATIDSQTKKYGETFTAPTTTITKNGYDLVGWLLNGADYDFSTPASADINLKAKWEAIPYDITYDLADDSTDPATVSGNPDTYTIEDTITLNNPTREHYDFAGWTGTDLSGPTMSVTISGSTGVRNYTATWKKKEYTATFMDGTTVITTQTKEYMEQFTEPTKPTKTGYDFNKWQLNNVDYNFSTPVTGNIELQATWTPTVYHITYDLTGGTAGSPANKTTYTIEDETFTLVNPTMAGHAFKGWKLYGDTGNPQTDMKVTKGTTGDLTFIAHWAGLVTVEFDSGVPGMVITPDAIEVEENTALPTLPQPTREHYTFDGWYLGTTKVEAGYVIGNTDIELLAKWVPVPYSITYNYDGGDAVNQSTYTIEDTFTLNNPTKTGFEFDGWTGTGLNAMTKDVTVPVGSSGARNYIAHWTQLFTVTFDGNGGTPALTTVDVRNGATVSKPADPTRTDYVFKGWKLNGADYNFDTLVTGNITLKAEWQVGKSILSLDGKGMSTKMKQLANPTSGVTSGYDFTDTKTKAFVRADRATYDAAVSGGLITDANNKISTGDSLASTYMWFDSSTGTMYYYTEAAKIYIDGSMDRMFAKFPNITDWSGLEGFDTSGATAMDRLFQDSPAFDDAALEYIKDWDTSNVTDMTFIFGANASSSGNKITKLTALTNWDVSKVKSFYQAFKHATKLESLGKLVDDPKNPGTQIYDGLGQWVVSSVGYYNDTSLLPSGDNYGFAQMFNGCTSLDDAAAIVGWDITNAISTAVNGGKNRNWAFDKMLATTPARTTQPAFTAWAPGGTWSDNGTFSPKAAL